MPRFFDGSDDVIRWSIGGLTGITAACTMAAILKRSSASTFDHIIGLHSSGGTVQPWFEITDADLLQFGHQSATAASSFTVMTTDNWVLAVVAKASGTATPRFHKYVYSTDAWTHSDGDASISNGSAPGAGGYAEIAWQGFDVYHGDIAAIGIWPTNLSDAQIENLGHSLAGWWAVQPSALWLLDQSAITQNVPDMSGGGANQSAITGTTVSTSVPGFSYGAPAGLWSVESAAPPPAADPLPDPFRRRLPLLVR